MNSATPDLIDYICRQCEGSVICHLQDSKIKKFLHNFKVNKSTGLVIPVLNGFKEHKITENILDYQESVYLCPYNSRKYT